MEITTIRIIFMAKETKSSTAALQYLVNKKIEIVRAIIRDEDDGLRIICESNHIMMCNEEELLADYKNGKLRADYILSFYWKKVGREVLRIPNKGSINFHPGPLPEARGSGYHVAILENWG